MKRISARELQEEAIHGKNEPMAKGARVQKKQNGEVEPLISTVRKQPGTDASRQRNASDA